MDTLTMLQHLHDQHAARLAAIDIDVPAIYHRYEAARAETHPLRTLKAIVPPDIYSKLKAYGDEMADYHTKADAISGRHTPASSLEPTTHDHLIGCPVEVAETHSGQVEFVAVDGR